MLQLIWIIPLFPQRAWSEKSSVSIEALCQEPMIVREAGSGTLQVLKAALRSKGMNLGEHFRIIAEIGNTVGIIGAVKSGLGVSVFSTMAIEDDLREGRLIALDIQDLNLERQIYIADDERRTLSPLAHAFRHYISHLMEGKPGGAL